MYTVYIFSSVFILRCVVVLLPINQKSLRSKCNIRPPLTFFLPLLIRNVWLQFPVFVNAHLITITTKKQTEMSKERSVLNSWQPGSVTVWKQ